MTINALREKILECINRINSRKHLQLIYGLVKTFSETEKTED